MLPPLEISFEFAPRFTPKENCFPCVLASSSSSSPASFFSERVAGGGGHGELPQLGCRPRPHAAATPALGGLYCGFAMWANVHLLLIDVI